MSDYSIVGVDHFTICQFTGLKDCEGKEIWEGDIVEREIYDLYKGSSKVKAVIEYMDGAFVAITDEIPYSLYFKYIKVIDNKFDKEKQDKTMVDVSNQHWNEDGSITVILNSIEEAEEFVECVNIWNKMCEDEE